MSALISDLKEGTIQFFLHGEAESKENKGVFCE